MVTDLMLNLITDCDIVIVENGCHCGESVR